MNSVNQRTQALLSDAADSFRRTVPEMAAQLGPLVEAVVEAFQKKRKLLVCGNGGSAADAQHLAAEFVNRYKIDRPPLPALALTTDSSILTSVGNDFSFDDVFYKQVIALGEKGDVFLGISTSGNSPNVLRAFEAAKEKGLVTAALLGKDGGQAAKLAEIPIVVPLKETARIQEVHLALEHTLCELVDEILFTPAGT